MKATTKPEQQSSIQDRAWYEHQVKLGVEDLEAGRVISDKQHRQNVEAAVAEVHTKHAGGKKVA